MEAEGPTVQVLDLPELGVTLRVDGIYEAAGRLRLAVPADDGGAAGRRVAEHLRSLAGVEDVRRGERNGRLLVRFGPRARLADLVRELPAPAPPARRRAERPTRAPALHVEPSFPWHAREATQALRRLGSGREGLEGEEVRRRLAAFGANTSNGVATRSSARVLLDQVSNLPTELLLGSAAVSLLLRDLGEAAAIGTVVALNAGIGFGIERRNEQLIELWRRIEAGEARALRDGRIVRIAAADLVPGDVLLCQAGDVLAADARVLDSDRLTTNEALLTGESEPQQKSAAPVPEPSDLAERRSMLYAGTTVVSGRGRAVVVATGHETELARIRALVAAQRAPRAPLEKRMARRASSAAARSAP